MSFVDSLQKRYPRGITAEVLAVEALNGLLVELSSSPGHDPHEFLGKVALLLADEGTKQEVSQYYLAKLLGWIEVEPGEVAVAAGAGGKEVKLLDTTIAKIFAHGFIGHFQQLVENHATLDSAVLHKIAGDILPLEES